MNPNGRKGSFVAVLMVLQWIQPFMLLVSRGGNALLEALRKVKALKYVAMFSIKQELKVVPKFFPELKNVFISFFCSVMQ